MTTAVSGSHSPDLPHLPQAASQAASIGHDKAGHTYRKIAITAGVTAAVAFFAIAVFATLAIPPIALLTLPAMTFTAVVGGLAIGGALAFSIFLASTAAARAFNHSSKGDALAPLLDDVEYEPKATMKANPVEASAPASLLGTQFYTKTYSTEEAKQYAERVVEITFHDQLEKDIVRMALSPVIQGSYFLKDDIAAYKAAIADNGTHESQLKTQLDQGLITPEKYEEEKQHCDRRIAAAKSTLIQSYKDTLNVFTHGNETAEKNLRCFLTQAIGNVATQIYTLETQNWANFTTLPYLPILTFKDNGELELKSITLGSLVKVVDGHFQDDEPQTPFWISNAYTLTMDALASGDFSKAKLTAAAFPASSFDRNRDDPIEAYNRDYAAYFGTT